MATTYLKSDFYKYIAPHARGVPEPTVEDAVEDVIIDFCSKTSLYRQWLEDTISVGIDDTEIELDIPNDTAIVEIMAVQKLDDDGNPTDEFVPDEDYVFSNQSDNLPKLIFSEPSTEEYEARVRVALRPEIGFSTVPTWLYERWRNTIVEGVLAYLLSMRSKPWYAQSESALHMAAYERDVGRVSAGAVLETINKVKRPTSRYI